MSELIKTPYTRLNKAIKAYLHNKNLFELKGITCFDCTATLTYTSRLGIQKDCMSRIEDVVRILLKVLDFKIIGKENRETEFDIILNMCGEEMEDIT